MKTVLATALAAIGLAAQTQPQGSIEGQVLNGATGAPLKKASVRLMGLGARNGQGRGAASMPPVLNKETDDQGHFAFTGLDAGRYSLSAQRTGFLHTNYGAHHLNGSGVPIPLGQDQHVKDVALKMSPQSVITGKVLDDDGDPVSGVQVRAMRNVYRGGRRQWAQVGNAQTSDIGEYRVANLEPGRYLVATNPRMNNEIMQTPTAGPLPEKPEMVAAATYYPNGLDSNGGAPIDVGPGAEVRGIDIRLRKVQAFRIRGKVNVPADSPRGGVTVMVSPKDGMGVIQSMSMARPPENKFEILGVPAGSYVVHARIGNGQQGQVAYQFVDVANHVDGLMLAPAPAIDIPGVLKVAESGAQVDLSNVNVNTRPVGFVFGGAARAKAGADQTFLLKSVNPSRFAIGVGGLPDTCFVKSIRYGGQDVTEAGVEPAANTSIEITVSTTAGLVTGTVADKDGNASAGSTVVLIPVNKDQPANSTTTDENGAFTFHALKPGDYKVIAWEDVESGAWQDPEFMKPWESKTTDVKIDPSGKATVQIRVQ